MCKYVVGLGWGFCLMLLSHGFVSCIVTSLGFLHHLFSEDVSISNEDEDAPNCKHCLGMEASQLFSYMELILCFPLRCDQSSHLSGLSFHTTVRCEAQEAWSRTLPPRCPGSNCLQFLEECGPATQHITGRLLGGRCIPGAGEL